MTIGRPKASVLPGCDLRNVKSQSLVKPQIPALGGEAGQAVFARSVPSSYLQFGSRNVGVTYLFTADSVLSGAAGL